MSAHQKLAAAFATTLALSAVSAAQLGNAQPGGAGQDGDIVLVDRTCFLNATVEGTWTAPTDETGRLLGTMYNSQGEPLFRLDAEISRYIFQQVDGVPGEEVDAGGIMGSAYALTGAEVELHVQGEWLRRAGEAGSFGLTLFVIGDHIPLIAVGAMQGEFLPAGEPSDPPQEGPFIMEPDRKDLPRVPYGDDLRGPVRDGAVATGGLGQGGSIGATAAGAKNLGSARGIDLPGEQHDSVVGAKKLGAAWSLSEVELNPPASLDDDVVDTREVGGARSLDETSIDEPPFRMPRSGMNAPRQGGTISATVSGAKNVGSARGIDLPGEQHDAVVGAKKLGAAWSLSEVELNPPASLDDDVVDTREVGGARSLDETSIDEPPFRMPGSGINAPRQGGTISATVSGAKHVADARGLDLPGEQHDAVVGAKKLGAAWSLSEVELNPPASLDDDVVDTREVGGARSLDETSIDEPPFRMPGSGINAPRQGGTISATVSGASTAGSAQGFDLPGENDAVAGARKLGGARDLGDGTLVHAPLKSGAFLGHWELCMGG